jgi:VIT1/CCC1 family predicted Fe2+/Mn2+ transporter
MIARKTTIPFLFLLLLLTNCTIEKRVFQPGYSIEWKHRIASKNHDEVPDAVAVKTEETHSSLSDSSDNQPVSMPETNPSFEMTGMTEKTGDSLKRTGELSFVPIQTETSEPAINSNRAELKNPSERLVSRQMEPFGIFSFGFYLLTVALTVIGFVLINSGGEFVLIAAAFLLFLSLIFGIFSVDRYRQNKEKYYVNALGYIGLIASIVTICLTGFYFILFLVA